ncbi:PREDICTED: uncharacterized protein LOC108782257 [Cyphomyrmex costatus]|uniref:uncharacterized protein LOC108782257 n=1 Tax=Cyphomyrmex costatus TaxID=456900 RepID=UPI00085227D0|nr:PREDICTED: uncharacterized protein LOC108782257 [Cyphomyrmex costatus]
MKSFKRRDACGGARAVGATTMRKEVESLINRLTPDSCLQEVVIGPQSVMDPCAGITPGDPEVSSCPPSSSVPDLADRFSMHEMNLALSGLRLNSAPGLDRIDNNIIASLPNAYLEHLLEIFNDLLEDGDFPPSWRKSLIIPVPKAGNRGFRPIALMSCMLKLLERMILRRLKHHVESRPILPNTQMGFRPHRSCADNLVVLTNHIRTAFSRGELTVAAFLDIKGAFDNVIPAILVNDLREIDVPPTLRQFIAHLISERELYFVVDGELVGPRFTRTGTPQGSTLSPLLFDIYLRGINENLTEGCFILQYADDLVLYASAKTLAEALSYLQPSLDAVNSYLWNRGLELSPSKSTGVVFTNKRSLRNKDFILTINGQCIATAHSVKFLGVILDSGLTGKEQLMALTSRGNATAKIISSLSGVWWGSHPRVLLTLYRALFRSAIEYGAQVFAYENQSTLFLKLERIQYKIIRLAMGYRISTPINVLLYEAKECPLKQRFNLLTASFLYKCWSGTYNLVKEGIKNMDCTADSVVKRIKALKSSPTYNRYAIHHEDLQKVFHSVSSPEFTYDYETFIHEPLCKFDMSSVDKDSPPELIALRFKQHAEELIANSEVSLYTDGSKIGENGSVGAAVYSPEEDFRTACKLPEAFSVFSAEAWAIREALVYVSRRGKNSAVIFTDSQSVLAAISSGHYSQPNYIVYQIKNLLTMLARERKLITLFWVPSHKGICGNEIVDRLANSAAASADPVTEFPVPFTDARKSARDSVKRTFEGWLKNAAQLKGTKHAELYQNSSPSPWFYSKSLEREEIVLINRIRSNHYNLNESLYRKGMTASAACHCGHESQDVNHVIYECPESRNKAEYLLKFLLEKYPTSTPNNIFPLLNKPSVGLCRRLLAFFKSLDVRL